MMGYGEGLHLDMGTWHWNGMNREIPSLERPENHGFLECVDRNQHDTLW
jgi:hypothetical protein